MLNLFIFKKLNASLQKQVNANDKDPHLNQGTSLFYLIQTKIEKPED